MVLEAECFHGIGAFEVYLYKVSAQKFFHPSVCPVLTLCWNFNLKISLDP
jgi:hypothetical protein